jgi:hypothetical protein
MDDSLRLQSGLDGNLKQLSATRATPRRTNTDDEVSEALRGELWQLFITADDGHACDVGDRLYGIENGIKTSGQLRLDEDSPMASGSD